MAPSHSLSSIWAKRDCDDGVMVVSKWTEHIAIPHFEEPNILVARRNGKSRIVPTERGGPDA